MELLVASIVITIFPLVMLLRKKNIKYLHTAKVINGIHLPAPADKQWFRVFKLKDIPGNDHIKNEHITISVPQYDNNLRCQFNFGINSQYINTAEAGSALRKYCCVTWFYQQKRLNRLDIENKINRLVEEYEKSFLKDSEDSFDEALKKSLLARTKLGTGQIKEPEICREGPRSFNKN